MVPFLNNGPFREHHSHPGGVSIIDLDWPSKPNDILFLGKEESVCVAFKANQTVHTSYFIGVDWVVEHEKAIYVEPKINDDGRQTNYLAMVFSAFRNPDVAKHAKDLFEIKYDKPPILIEQKDDLITPLLVIQFLGLVKRIAQKGLKKSYYQTEQNLQGRVKGKVLIGKTIKHNHVKNRLLKTYCTFEEFGVNGLENRLLKKALVFVNRYLATSKIDGAHAFAASMFAFINPVFEFVSAEVEIREVVNLKPNPFFKEYTEAIRLANLILRQFGYHISNIQEKKQIKVAPFWIDMSKLFELYVLGFLKVNYGNRILYGSKEASGKYGLPDFLMPHQECPLILDAKYKQVYKQEKYEIENIRQLSGYARDKGILKKLGKELEERVVSCIIIYPDTDQLYDADFRIDIEKTQEVHQFTKFYKIGVPLPVI